MFAADQAWQFDGLQLDLSARTLYGRQGEELVLRRTRPDETKPYERLIGDALDGDPTMFAERVAVEESWRVVDPILGKSEVFSYEPGSWGPAEASRIQPEGGWSNPE